MDDCSIAFSMAEGLDQLVRARDLEIKLIKKYRMVLKTLQQQIPRHAKMTDENPLQQAIKVLQIGEYLRLNEDDDDWLLDLRDLRNISLSYTERKTLRQQLAADLRKQLHPIAAFGQRMRAELPEIFSAPFSEATASSTPPQTPKAQILALETRRRENFQKLLILRNRKCGYLKAAAELKMGPYLGHEQELIFAQARHNQIKAELLRSYALNEFVTRTEHSLKAIKEVSGYVNEQFEQLDEK